MIGDLDPITLRVNGANLTVLDCQLGAHKGHFPITRLRLGKRTVWGCDRCIAARPDARRAQALNMLGDDPAAASGDALRAIADGPIMDSNRLYLPAGKISQAEAEKRERDGVEIVANGRQA